MVTGYTATEIGDVLVARLKNPYTDALRVLGWDIVAGVTTPRTNGINLSFTAGSNMVTADAPFTIGVGERIIVGNQYFTVKTAYLGSVCQVSTAFSIQNQICEGLDVSVSTVASLGDLPDLCSGLMVLLESQEEGGEIELAECKLQDLSVISSSSNTLILRISGSYVGPLRWVIGGSILEPSSVLSEDTFVFDISHLSGGEYTAYVVDGGVPANMGQFEIVEKSTFTASGLKFYEDTDQDNDFVYEYRWSQNKEPNGGQMSEFRPLNNGMSNGDLMAINFNSELPLWIDIRATLDRMSNSSISLSILSITYELETSGGTIEACPQFCEECEDPWAFVGCEGITVECETNIFKPYELQRPVNLYKQITDVSTSIWGHEVRYFRVEPDQRSKDVILMEYSLYNVVEEGMVKVMVPDNEFPTEEFSYDIFGMGFENFEIHITKTEFNKAFGLGPSPRSRDYLFFPFNNRMYEVVSVTFADEFNRSLTYWRVQLKKYEDRTSSIHTDDVVEQAVDDLVVGVEEVFGEEIQEEFEKVTKPQQYKTVFHVVQDGIRAAIHKKLKIADIDLRNRWTVISRNYYDLTTAGERVEQQPGVFSFEFDEAIIYNLNSSLAPDNNLAYAGWFKPTLNTTFDTTHQTILDGLDGDKGILIETSRVEFRVTLNDQVYTYDFGSVDNANNPFFEATDSMWFSMVINISNQYNEMSVNIYRLNDEVNEGLPQNAPNRLELAFNETTAIPVGLTWETSKQYALRGGYMHMTNVRIFTKTIEAEQQANVLQQYVVRDSHLNILTDNAIPSIMLRKYSQGR